MPNVNKDTQEFIDELNKSLSHSKVTQLEDTIKTSRTASNLAAIYESARNAVEFRAEHLIRQGAINRILKRRLFLNQPSQGLSSSLIKELLWARYLQEESIATSKIKDVAEIIDKYRNAIKQSSGRFGGKKDADFAEWLVGLAACEIEEKLAFNPIPQILINYVFLSLSKKIDFEEKDTQTKSIQLYVATERGFAKNSELLISYRLLKTLLPSWFKTSAAIDLKLYEQLVDKYQLINKQLNHSLRDQLRRIVLGMSPPFNLIRELIEEHPDDFINLVANSETLEETAKNLLEKRYRETREKLTRASGRSIVYIFLTKMVFGLSLELPFDFFLGQPNYLALVINSFFPVFLIFLLNTNVKLPDEENTPRMITKIEEYFYGNQETKSLVASVEKKRGKIDRVLLVIHFITFILIFGGIIWLLNILHFNPVSQIIFLFFLSVVSFFAYKVRGIAKEYYLPEEEKEGFFMSLLDFVFLPIIKVGQWLSVQISNFNIISFIFDFIIEAPLKAFLGIIEEWIHFVRIKREEITT